MATLPTSETPNRYQLKLLRPPGDGGAGCACPCHGGSHGGGHAGCGCGCGPALGLWARPDTFEALLPSVKALIQLLQGRAEGGKLAEVDLALLHLLEDWIVASRAEIDARGPHRTP